MLLPHHHHMEVIARENGFMMVKTYSLLIRLWALRGSIPSTKGSNHSPPPNYENVLTF